MRGIMHWSPMREMDRFFDEDAWGADFVPAINVFQDKDNVIVETSLPGIDPEKVDISVENDVLTISGSREEKSEIKREDYYRKEIREGSFSRSVILPMAVKASEAKAHAEKGILRITLPKAEEVKPKKISVEVKK
ncbi:MAG: Hsp20/alpha crystallin family protein [Candidatus Moranbacteria bacterium]|nr:Hsp20/alpha crystallin family protein [Candidatus Moranbacteria bacterium]